MKGAVQMRGYALTQLLIESAIVLGSIAVLLYATTGYVAAGRTEAIKQRCVIANISAIEVIKQSFYDSGDIGGSIGFIAESGGYVTAVTSFEEIIHGTAATYRVAVDTRHKDNYIPETELIVYLSSR
jgi:hypothetical protein